MEQNEALNLSMEEDNKSINQNNKEPVMPMGNPGVVYGLRECQTRDVEWICVQDIYNKFQRPNMYNIGGTYIEDVAHYWFTFKSEQVGYIYLLHLFLSNRSEGPCAVAVSSSSELKLDKKLPIAYLPKSLTTYQFADRTAFSCKYITTYSFTDLDVKFLEERNLYIAVSFPLTNTTDLGADIKIGHDFRALLEEPIGSDFIIESANGFKFNVHKALLAAYSEVFKAMLKDETAESQNGYVKLSDISEEDLRCMMEYIYTGAIKDINKANFVNLFILGDRYNLKGLVELCEHALTQQLAIDNAIDILVVADMYDSDVLKQSTFKFIKKNMAHLKNSLKEINNADLYRQLCMYFI